MASTVTYEFYTDTFGGGLSEAAFAASLPTAEAHVHWLCELRELGLSGMAFTGVR